MEARDTLGMQVCGLSTLNEILGTYWFNALSLALIPKLTCFSCTGWLMFASWTQFCKIPGNWKMFSNSMVAVLVQIPARGRVGRVMDCGVKGLGFKSPGSILTSRTETSSLSRVVRDGWDPWYVTLSGEKSLMRWSLRFGHWTATTVHKTTQKQKQKQKVRI